MSTLSISPSRQASVTDLLLLGLVAVPVLYYGTLLIAASLYPGYSHVTQYASELGSASARYPGIFNTGTILGGIAGVLGAVGTWRALRSVGSGRLIASLLALAIALHGVGLIFGGLFPMPDDRHGGYGLGLGGLFGPLLGAIALLRAPRTYRWLAWLLFANAAATWTMFAIMMGVGELVTLANVGLFQRGFSLTIMPWLAVLGWVLIRWHGACRGNGAI